MKKSNELRSKIDGFNAEISTLQASIAEEVAQAKQRINDINSQAIVAGDNAQNQMLVHGFSAQLQLSAL